MFFAVLALAGAVIAQDNYNAFYLTANGTCPDGSFDVFSCPPPSVCAHDNLIDKYYCCGPADGVCWDIATSCTTGVTSSCGSGDNSYCCLSSREECTQRSGQINICWATADNPVANFTVAEINNTFSSLSSAHPAATTYKLNLASLAAAESSTATTKTNTGSGQTTSTSTSTGVAQSSTNSSSGTPAPTSSKSGLSGGAIAGIVIAVVAGLAIAGAAVFFFLRRRNAYAAPQDTTPATPGQEGYSAPPGAGFYAPKEKAGGAYYPPPATELATEDRTRHELSTQSEGLYELSSDAGAGGVRSPQAPQSS